MAETQKITASVAESGVLCVDSNGNRVMAGGGGPRATDLLLMAVAGCSGAVLKVVLAKEGFTPATIEMSIEGVRADHPRRFSAINAHYDVICTGLTEDKLKECLEKTEKACPVIQSLSVEMKYTFTLNKG
jgi:uncharacterized OsmC-like protein